MRRREFERVSIKLEKFSKEIMESKGPEYTDETEDILSNFKNTAKRLNISPLKVWAVFFDKQCSSLFAHVNNELLQESEPIDSRFADIINYCYLGLGLFKERKK